jgi:hypothetical protein
MVAETCDHHSGTKQLLNLPHESSTSHTVLGGFDHHSGTKQMLRPHN